MNNTKVNEIFKPIVGYEKLYLVSNYGRIKRIKGDRFVKRTKHKGYLMATLNNGIKRKSIHVHQLVAMTFLNGFSKKCVLVVHHINHKGTDNRVENLKMVSHRENCSLRKKDNGMPTGVEARGKRYYSKIVLNGKQKRLGSYETPEEASLVYQKELQKHIQQNR